MNLISAGASRFASQNETVNKTSVSKSFENDDDWREARRSGIGGSEISALLGLNPFDDKSTVMASKLYGREKVSTPAMVEGAKLEALVVHEFAKRPEGQQFERIERNKRLFRRRDLPFAIATPDAFLVVGDDKSYGVLECKTAVRRWGPEKIEMAKIQNLWYQYVTGADFGYIACLEARSTLHVVPVPRDDEYIEQMVQAAVEFWNEFQALKNGTN